MTHLAMKLMLAAEAAGGAATLEDVLTKVEQAGRLMQVVLGVLVVLAVALVLAHRRLAKNQVELAAMVRKAVDQLEQDLRGE